MTSNLQIVISYPFFQTKDTPFKQPITSVFHTFSIHPSTPANQPALQPSPTSFLPSSLTFVYDDDDDDDDTMDPNQRTSAALLGMYHISSLFLFLSSLSLYSSLLCSSSLCSPSFLFRSFFSFSSLFFSFHALFSPLSFSSSFSSSASLLFSRLVSYVYVYMATWLHG